MAAKVMFDGRGAQGHIQCLCHMQCTGLSVRTDTAVVVDAVGHIGILLHLGNDDALADGVQRAGRDKEAVPLMHRHSIQHLRQSVVFNALLKFRFGDLVVEAVVKICARLTVQHIPHLGFAVLVFIFQCVIVGRMHLNGEVILGINELRQDRELLKFVAVGAKAAGVGGKIRRQRGTVRQVTRAVRVAGKHPRLRQWIKVALDSEIRAQAAAAPQIILAAGSQLDYCHILHTFIIAAAASASAAFTASAAASLSPTADR